MVHRWTQLLFILDYRETSSSGLCEGREATLEPTGKIGNHLKKAPPLGETKNLKTAVHKTLQPKQASKDAQNTIFAKQTANGRDRS